MINDLSFLNDQFSYLIQYDRLSYPFDLSAMKDYISRHSEIKKKLLKSEYLTDLATNLGVLQDVS